MMDYVNKSTSQQLVERLGYNLEITIMSDVVHGLDYEYKQLEQENQQLQEKIEYLKNKIENKDNWCQLIADIGFDYDGCNKVDSLKCLIDELVKYALYSRDSYDYEEFIKEGNNE